MYIFYILNNMISFLYIYSVHEIRQNYIIIFLKIMRRKKICIFCQTFNIKHKINKSDTKLSTHYWIVCLYYKNVCFNLFITNKFYNFLRNMLYSKTIKIIISLFFTYKATQWVPISEYSSRFIIYVSFFILLGKLSLE